MLVLCFSPLAGARVVPAERRCTSRLPGKALRKHRQTKKCDAQLWSGALAAPLPLAPPAQAAAATDGQPAAPLLDTLTDPSLQPSLLVTGLGVLAMLAAANAMHKANKDLVRVAAVEHPVGSLEAKQAAGAAAAASRTAAFKQRKQAGERLVWTGVQLARVSTWRASALAATSAVRATSDTSARLSQAVTQARELQARAAQLRASMDEVSSELAQVSEKRRLLQQRLALAEATMARARAAQEAAVAAVAAMSAAAAPVLKGMEVEGEHGAPAGAAEVPGAPAMQSTSAAQAAEAANNGHAVPVSSSSSQDSQAGAAHQEAPTAAQVGGSSPGAGRRVAGSTSAALSSAKPAAAVWTDTVFAAQTLAQFPDKGVATAEEARVLLEKGGYTFLDVRPAEQLEAVGHVRRGVNVPFVQMERGHKEEAGDKVPQAHPNDYFLEQVRWQFPSLDSLLLVGDSDGQTLTPQAVEVLKAAGYSRIVVLQGGFAAWSQVFDSEGQHCRMFEPALA